MPVHRLALAPLTLGGLCHNTGHRERIGVRSTTGCEKRGLAVSAPRLRTIRSNQPPDEHRQVQLPDDGLQHGQRAGGLGVVTISP